MIVLPKIRIPSLSQSTLNRLEAVKIKSNKAEANIQTQEQNWWTKLQETSWIKVPGKTKRTGCWKVQTLVGLNLKSQCYRQLQILQLLMV